MAGMAHRSREQTSAYTLADLKRAARKHGGTVVDESGGFTVCYVVDAPHGKKWKALGVHGFHVEWDRDGAEHHRQSAIAAGIETASAGLEDCNNPNCEACNS